MNLIDDLENGIWPKMIMDKIKQIEELLDDWKAKERKINACDQVDLWEARGTANGIGLALAILKEQIDEPTTTKGQAECTCSPNAKPHYCKEHGFVGGFPTATR